MKNIIHFPSFIIALLVAAAFAYLGSTLFHLNFWICFIITIIAMILNGLLATFEDEQPGGFNNPISKKDKEE